MTWRSTTTIVISAMLLTVAVPAASAVQAGVSGSCKDGQGGGGGGEVRVSDTDGVTLTGVTDLSVVDAAVLFATNLDAAATGGDACPEYDCEEESDGDHIRTCATGETPRRDHLEASASAAGQSVQACYDGEVRTDGDCPQSAA